MLIYYAPVLCSFTISCFVVGHAHLLQCHPRLVTVISVSGTSLIRCGSTHQPDLCSPFLFPVCARLRQCCLSPPSKTSQARQYPSTISNKSRVSVMDCSESGTKTRSPEAVQWHGQVVGVVDKRPQRLKSRTQSLRTAKLLGHRGLFLIIADTTYRHLHCVRTFCVAHAPGDINVFSCFMTIAI